MSRRKREAVAAAGAAKGKQPGTETGWKKFTSARRAWIAAVVLLLIGLGAAGAFSEKYKHSFLSGSESLSNAAAVQLPIQTGTPQLSKEYIYAGGRMLTVEDTASNGISGKVNYGTTTTGQAPKLVPEVKMSATNLDNGESVASNTTDLSGSYLLGNLPFGGRYKVTPTTSAKNVNGISPFDATMVLRHVAANGTGPDALNANQQIAADANNHGGITPFDATLILRYVAGGGRPAADGSTGNVGKWKFDPAERIYDPFSSIQPEQNYTGFLIGEVNGSWSPTGETMSGGQGDPTTNTIQISLPQNATAVKDSNVYIPVSFSKSDSNVTVRSYSFQATFNPAVLQPKYAGIAASGTLSQGCSTTTNIITPGKIGVASSCPISAASGTLINLNFTVIGQENTSTGTTLLTFLTTSEDTQTPWFEDTNNNPISTGVTQGQFTVTPPSAAAMAEDSLSAKNKKGSSAEVSASATAFVPEAEQQQPGAEAIQISLPANAAATQGSTVSIPVVLTNNAGANVSGFSFDVQFNPALLRPAALAIDNTGTLSGNCFVEANRETPGRINIAGSCADRITASTAGTLVNLRFTVAGQANNASAEARALKFHQTPVFEDQSGNQIAVGRTNGSIR
jgi:hypothetical protein